MNVYWRPKTGGRHLLVWYIFVGKKTSYSFSTAIYISTVNSYDINEEDGPFLYSRDNYCKNMHSYFVVSILPANKGFASH